MTMVDPCPLLKTFIEESSLKIVSDYDSDETVVCNSLSGSDNEDDDLHLARLIKGSNGSLTPPPLKLLINNGNNGMTMIACNVVGQMSPEIQPLSKLPSRVEKALREVGDAVQEEEHSQSILRNWRKGSSLTVLRTSASVDSNCPDTSVNHISDTGVCDDAQCFMNSPEYEIGNGDPLQTVLVGLSDNPNCDLATASANNEIQQKEQPSIMKMIDSNGSAIEAPLCKSGSLTQIASEISNYSCRPFIGESSECSSDLASSLVNVINSMQSPEMHSHIDQLWHYIEGEDPIGEQATPHSDRSVLITHLPSEHETSVQKETKDEWDQSFHQPNVQDIVLNSVQEVSILVNSADISRNCDADQKCDQKSSHPDCNFDSEDHTYAMSEVSVDTSSLQPSQSVPGSAAKEKHPQSCTPHRRKSLRIARNAGKCIPRKKTFCLEMDTAPTTPAPRGLLAQQRKVAENRGLKLKIPNKELISTGSAKTPGNKGSKKRKGNTSIRQPSTKRKKKENIHKRNAMGETKLHRAARIGDLAQVTTFIEAGINVNQRDNAGWAAIHEASCYGFPEIALALLEAGADVNSKGYNDVLPIHDAVLCNHYKVVELLLKFGADLHATDKVNENAFDKCCDEKMLEFLKSHSLVKKGQKRQKVDVLSACGTTSDNMAECSWNPTHPTCHRGKKKDLNSNANSTPVKDKKDTSRENVAFSITLKEAERKQNALLSTELNTLEEAEKYIEEMQHIQHLLNNFVTQQRQKREEAATKSRASTDSFNGGILRDEGATLAHSQKSLLQLAYNQKHVALKIGEFQQMKTLDFNIAGTCPSLHHSPGRNPVSVKNSHNNKLFASHSNGKDMAPIMSSASRAQDSEGSQFQKASMKSILSSEISEIRAVPEGELASEKTRDCSGSLTLDKIQHGKENGLLGIDSFPCLSTTNVGDFLKRETQKNMSIDKTFNVTDDSNMTHTNVNQQISNVKHQSMKPHSNRLNLDEQIHNTDMALSECELPSQLLAEQKELTVRPGKFISLRKLIKMGKIRPGKDVLSFQLQDYSHKATLLPDGNIRDCSGTVHPTPGHWLKALLGNNISVTKKYFINKVTYCGKELAHFQTEEYIAPKTAEEPSKTHAQGKMAEIEVKTCEEASNKVSPVLFKPLQRVMQVKEILVCDKSEFLPSHITDHIWEEFKNSDKVDF